MIKINANAKVNLFLKVKDKRSDGYHNIESIMQEINLYDELTIENSSDGKFKIVNINVVKDDIPWDEKNLIYKAYKAFIDAFDVKDKSIVVSIKKNIPTSAGLGGGSSDAAATLIGIDKLWKTNLPLDRLTEIGSKVGSDVPFFIHGKTALVTGKGEIISPLSPLKESWFVLIKPALSVSTKWAYDEFDLDNKNLSWQNSKNSYNDMTDYLKYGKTDSIYRSLYNNLENVVLKHHPDLKAIKDTLINLGADNALLSGSGSTVFGIVRTEEKAKEIFKKIIPYNFGKVFFCNSVN